MSALQILKSLYKGAGIASDVSVTGLKSYKGYDHCDCNCGCAGGGNCDP